MRIRVCGNTDLVVSLEPAEIYKINLKLVFGKDRPSRFFVMNC